MTSEDLEGLVAEAQTGFYPCTITQTRYGGAYEGGRWAAFRCHPEDLPGEPFDEDVVASDWWHGEGADWVGLGRSPDGAFRSLVARWAERGCAECRGMGMIPVGGGFPGRRACEACSGWGRDQPVRCLWCGARLRSTRLAGHYAECDQVPGRAR